ncbi:Uncharacterised protein [Mycobacteroides abscessus subsp. abscessus]|nr:Uncharacterised protein [Mycobacteroides abscessus subsp. abscessus]
MDSATPVYSTAAVSLLNSTSAVNSERRIRPP